MYEFVDGVDEGFDRCCDDIGIGGESVVMYTVVSNGHMHFTHVVASFGNGLDQEFLYRHLPVYNLLYRFEAASTGNGPVDAAIKAVKQIIHRLPSALLRPMLLAGSRV